MELFFQFVSQEWYWFGLLSLLATVLMLHERRKAGPQVSPAQLSMLINNEDALVLDVRADKEFRKGHVVGAMNVPYNQLNDRIDQLDKYKGRPVVLVCKMGSTTGSVAKRLRERGFEKVYRLNGGMMEWSASQMPVVKS